MIQSLLLLNYRSPDFPADIKIADSGSFLTFMASFQYLLWLYSYSMTYFFSSLKDFNTIAPAR